MESPPTSRHGEPPAQEKHWAESWTLFGVVAVLLVLVSSLVWWQLVHTTSRIREEASAQAQLRASQLASATVTAAAILFRAVDITSRELSISFSEGRLPRFEERLRLAYERLPPGSLLQVAVIGADGYLAYSNLGMGEKLFLGDREHFKAHVGTTDDRLFISKPVLGRVSKQWTIQFSRPLLKGGQFQGVLVLSVSPAYLQQALGQIAVDSGDSIALLRDSGDILAGNREADSGLGRSVPPSRPFLQSGAPAVGTFVADSDLDSVRRIYTWQRLNGLPVIVLLGLNEDTVFQSANRSVAEDQFKTVVGLVLMWSAAFALVILGRRVILHLRRRDEMEFVAMTDSLTGLSSRIGLMRYLTRSVSDAVERGGRVGLLYLDLNRFKPVNDRYGHAAGDEVLRVVGARIRACVRSSDVAARIGGDEFVVVLAPLESSEDLEKLCERISQALKMPIAVAGTQVSISASLGAAVCPENGVTADALLAHADQQMYRQKAERSASRSGDEPLPVRAGVPV